MLSACGHFRLWTVLALLVISGVPALHAETPLPPKPDRYFNDYAHVVAPDVAQRLDAKLEQFERATTNQVLVVIFPKLPEDTYLEDYTVKTAQSWGTGGKQRQNGLILFVFTQDRKLRIEVGYGLEGAVPDSIASSIIREVIRPQFKAGNYAAGLEQGVEAIFKATRNEYKGTGTTLADSSDDAGSSNSLWIIIGLVAAFLIWCQMGDTMIQRGGRFVFWNLLDVARILMISGLSGGGGSSSDRGSSGGNYRGGGGTFGGGGASGDW
ncbi:MAG: hypothetical protein JWO89_169 [Verrucomicrobiaceae bacterium]|nr:hypothetical protein [Verrucomicrobiaceae bacterium]